MRKRADAIVDALRDDLGEGLHGAFYGNFKEHDYTVAYLHDDVRGEFEPGEITDLVSVIVDEQLELHDHDELDYMLGDVRTTVRSFENAAHVVSWDSREDTGLLVGVASDPETVGAALGAVEAELEA